MMQALRSIVWGVFAGAIVFWASSPCASKPTTTGEIERVSPPQSTPSPTPQAPVPTEPQPTVAPVATEPPPPTPTPTPTPAPTPSPIAAPMVAPSTKPAQASATEPKPSASGPPADHVKSKHGTMHKLGYKRPQGDCTHCHGKDLKGDGRMPSCYQCHGKKWH